MRVNHFMEARSCEPQPGWRRTSLADQAGVSVEHFVKPPRHASPMHSHPEAQICIVIKGRMQAVSEGRGRKEEVVLEKGDSVFFASNEPHQVINMLDEPSTGIEVFCPGRSFDFWTKKLAR